MESHYLLGRALVLLWLYQYHVCEECENRQHYFCEYHPLLQAYNAYQEAIYCDGDRCSTILVSVALLFFYINQYRDCLTYMARSIRLHPYKPLVWRNLGILVSNNFSAARAAYS